MESLRKDGDPMAKGKGLRANLAAYIQARYKPYFTKFELKPGSVAQRMRDEIAFRAASHMLGISLVLVCGDVTRPFQVLHYYNRKRGTILSCFPRASFRSMPSWTASICCAQEASELCSDFSFFDFCSIMGKAGRCAVGTSNPEHEFVCFTSAWPPRILQLLGCFHGKRFVSPPRCRQARPHQKKTAP